MIKSDSGEVNFALKRLAVRKTMTRDWSGAPPAMILLRRLDAETVGQGAQVARFLRHGAREVGGR